MTDKLMLKYSQEWRTHYVLSQVLDWLTYKQTHLLVKWFSSLIPINKSSCGLFSWGMAYICIRSSACSSLKSRKYFVWNFKNTPQKLIYIYVSTTINFYHAFRFRSNLKSEKKSTSRTIYHINDGRKH